MRFVHIVLFWAFLSGFPQGFKMRLLEKSFHTFANGGLFSSPNQRGHHNPPPSGPASSNVGHHNPPPSGPASSLALFPSSNHCGTTPKIHPLHGPMSLLAHGLVSTPSTPPRVYPLWRTARKLILRPVSSSNTICNNPDHTIVQTRD